jgi:hypothetical protein
VTRKDDPKLAQWADADAEDDGVPDMSTEMGASRESRRRATLSADGWSEGQDGLWRKSFDDAEWMPKCEVGHVTHAVVRDRATGVAIHDSTGSTHFDNGRLMRAFRILRNVDMIGEFNFAEEPSTEPLSWEETPIGAREASEYRAASARLNYLALDRPDILFASKEWSRRM